MDIPPIKSPSRLGGAAEEIDSLIPAEVGAPESGLQDEQTSQGDAYEAIPSVQKHAILTRCAALGLSLGQVQRLAGVDHSLLDFANILGLDRFTLTPLRTRRWLWMAAGTCSVSYRTPLTEERLLEVLTTGDLAPDDIATFLHFLDEAPLSIVVMAIEQTAQQSGVPIAQIWRNVDQIAAALSSVRLRIS